MNVPIVSAVAFDAMGFFEDLWVEGRHLGSRAVAWPDRPFGSDGQKEIELTGTTILRRGLKEVKIMASKEKPFRCYSVLSILCGKQLKIGDIVKVRRTPAEILTTLAPCIGEIVSIHADGRVGLTYQGVNWFEESWRLQFMQGKP